MATDQAAARAEIGERIYDAWETLKRLPDRERDLLMRGERGQQWPLMVHTAAEHAAWKPGQIRRPPPTARQIDRMHQALDWLTALGKQQRDYAKAVWVCCALKRKPGEAAKFIGCHRNTVRAWCENGLDRIVTMSRARRAA